VCTPSPSLAKLRVVYLRIFCVSPRSLPSSLMLNQNKKDGKCRPTERQIVSRDVEPPPAAAAAAGLKPWRPRSPAALNSLPHRCPPPCACSSRCTRTCMHACIKRGGGAEREHSLKWIERKRKNESSQSLDLLRLFAMFFALNSYSHGLASTRMGPGCRHVISLGHTGAVSVCVCVCVCVCARARHKNEWEPKRPR